MVLSLGQMKRGSIATKIAIILSNLFYLVLFEEKEWVEVKWNAEALLGEESLGFTSQSFFAKLAVARRSLILPSFYIFSKSGINWKSWAELRMEKCILNHSITVNHLRVNLTRIALIWRHESLQMRSCARFLRSWDTSAPVEILRRFCASTEIHLYLTVLEIFKPKSAM